MSEYHFPFHSEILRDSRTFRDKTHQSFRLVRMQVVRDDMPPFCFPICCHDRLHVGQEILVCARRTTTRRDHFSDNNITAEDKSTCAMTNILEFSSFHFARCQRQFGMFALQCLDSGEFIGTDRALPLLRSLGSLRIDCTNLFDGLFPLFILRRRQPIADEARLEIPFFKSRAA